MEDEVDVDILDHKMFVIFEFEEDSANEYLFEDEADLGKESYYVDYFEYLSSQESRNVV